MKHYWQRIAAAFERGRRFVKHDIWRIGMPGEAIPSDFITKQVRVCILLVRGIAQETLLLRASALTLATLLFIVPFLVFMFSFIQTFHLGDEVYSFLSEKLDTTIEAVIATVKQDTAPPAAAVPGTAEGEGEGELANLPTEEEKIESNEQLRNDLMRVLFPWRETLDETGSDYEDPVQILVAIADKGATSGKALGISGVIFVLTTVFGLMRNVEWSLNSIWGVRKSRNYFRTTSDYLLVTLLLPFVAAAVLGVTAALASPTIQNFLGPFTAFIRLGQFSFVSLSFALLYYLVPNTRVRFRNAFIGGIFAAVLWIALSWAYVHAHVGLARYTLVFSTFAAFPLLLMWTYASWTILLFGALVSFAYQNEKTFAMERLAGEAPYAYREALAVRIALELTRRFQSGNNGLCAEEMASAWNAPLRLVNETLECLIAAKLITACATEPVTYQPARAPGRTRIHEVIHALREAGRDPSLLRQESGYGPIYNQLDTAQPVLLEATLAEAAANLESSEAEEDQGNT